MNARDYIILEYSSLEDGQSLAGQLCPVCRGGQSGETTLSVSRRNGQLLWVCHRASCGFKGSSSTARLVSSDAGEQRSKGDTGRRLVLSGTALPDEVRQFVHNKFSIDATPKLFGWHVKESKLILPILSGRQQELVGCVLRVAKGITPEENMIPKAKSLADEDAMAWYLNRHSDDVLIVEDQLSAIRASKFINTIALLSVNLNDNRVLAILAAKFRRVFIALDKDAIAVAGRHMMRYRSMLNMRMISIQKDIKDMSDTELEEFKQEII